MKKREVKGVGGLKERRGTRWTDRGGGKIQTEISVQGNVLTESRNCEGLSPSVRVHGRSR